MWPPAAIASADHVCLSQSEGGSLWHDVCDLPLCAAGYGVSVSLLEHPPTPEPSTGLCVWCGADVALPDKEVCGACLRELTPDEPEEDEA